MQVVEGSYDLASKSKTRIPTQESLLDWDGNNDFADESINIKSLCIERVAEEYLSGVYSAQADIELIDDGKYIPMGEMPTKVISTDDINVLTFSNCQKKLLISSQGYYILVFQDMDVDSIYYTISKDNGVSWSNSVLIAADGNYPYAIIDSNDNIHVSFVKANGTTIKYAKLTFSIDSWSVGTIYTVQTAVSGEYYWTPSVQIADSGKTFVLYECTSATTGYHLYSKYTTDDGANWSSRVSINAGGDPDDIVLEINSIVLNDVLYIFWQKMTDAFDDIEISYATCNAGGAAYSAATVLVTSMVNDTAQINLTASEDNGISVLYEENSRLYLMNFNGSSWGDPIVINYNVSGYDSADITNDINNLYIAFYVTNSDIVNWVKYEMSSGVISQIHTAYRGTVIGLSMPVIIDASLGVIPLVVFDSELEIVYFSFLKSNANFNFRPGIQAKIGLGFSAEDKLQVFQGFSEMPQSDMIQGSYRLHLYDEIKKLNDYTLPQGDLYTDMRTDEYIGKILREYWGSDNYQVVCSCDDMNEWSEFGDANALSLEGIDKMEGEYSFGIEIDVSDSVENYAGVIGTLSSPIDLSKFQDIGKFRLWVYLPSITYMTGVSIRIGTDSSNYWLMSATTDFAGNDFKVGWNLIELDWLSASVVGTPDSTNTDYICMYVEYSASQGDEFPVGFDDLTVYMPNIPAYYHDKGINTIGLAWFEGNKAGYEIKTACEAEGGKFYQHEQGYFIFENRQHYNNNDEHKSSVLGVTFDNALDFLYPANISSVINYTEMTVEPRKLQSIKEVWNYGETPEFAAGETKTIWASLDDPCLLITTPAATTDYTANDGGVTDKTNKVSIVITKFAQAAKMDITNIDTSPIFLTMLKLRGTPYEKQGIVLVISENKLSQEKYGLRRPQMELENNKYFQNSTDTQAIADTIIDLYSNPSNVIQLSIKGIPQIQIGDLISVTNKKTSQTYLQRIIGINIKLQDNSLDMILISRRIIAEELATYFSIGVSSIGGTDVIAR